MNEVFERKWQRQRTKLSKDVPEPVNNEHGVVEGVQQEVEEVRGKWLNEDRFLTRARTVTWS